MTSHAQVFKCKNSQGAMEYSDKPCAESDSKKVNIVTPSFGGSIAGSAGDPNARALKIYETDKVRAGPIPQQCKFKYFLEGDAKGKSLAADAKEECLQNLENKINGRPISLEAYTLWKDHYGTKSAQRSAIATQINADANARRIDQKINQSARETNDKIDALGRKTYNCTSYVRGQLDCR
tara:strand:+ start:179667 stop:180206 length:540 start_codon:yes stop_codon:yes gene_type:complete